MRLPPLNGLGNYASKVFREPAVLVEGKDGKVRQTTLSELKRQGLNPNQNDDKNWWEKLRDNVKDVLYSFFLID